MSSLTFTVAVSVRAIIAGPPSQNLRASGYFDRNGHSTRVTVVQRRELHHASPADLVDHTRADSAVQIAHQLRIRLGELPERTVKKGDIHLVAGPNLGLGV